MPSIFSTIFSAVLRYNKQRTNDVVGAYPERLHVRALPERRYLKTSRVMAMIAFVSIAFNFGFAFVYMKMASSVSSVIAQPLPENPTAEQRARRTTRLYRLDMFNQAVKQIEPAETMRSARTLVAENLIEEYITLRYAIVPSYEEMAQRMAEGSKLYLLSSTAVASEFSYEKDQVFRNVRNGITREVYIYSIKNVNTDLFEVIFDVFTFDENAAAQRVCKCLSKDEACLTCLREKATYVQRYKAMMRVRFQAGLSSLEDVLQNPYFFNIYTYSLFPVTIQNDDPWHDIDRAL